MNFNITAKCKNFNYMQPKDIISRDCVFLSGGCRGDERSGNCRFYQETPN